VAADLTKAPFFMAKWCVAGEAMTSITTERMHNKLIVGVVSGAKSRLFPVEHANMATIEQILVRNTCPKVELHTEEVASM